MKIQAVLFDLDGTVLDTIGDLTDSLNGALEEFSLPPHSEKEVESLVGNGIRNLVKRAAPDRSKEELEQVYQSFMKRYRKHLTDRTRPYRGIEVLLKKLKQQGYKLGVISNKKEELVQRLCETFYPNLFDLVMGETEGIPRKPDKAMMVYALQQMEISREEVIYIGDSETDREAAMNAQIPCVLVAWGFRKRPAIDKMKSEYTVDTPEEIAELLKQLE